MADLQRLMDQAASDGVGAIRITLARELRQALSSIAPQSQPSGGLMLENWAELQAIIQWSAKTDNRIWIEAGDAAIDFLDAGLLGKFQGGLDLNPFRFFKEGKPDEGLMADLLPLVAHAIRQQNAADAND